MGLDFPSEQIQVVDWDEEDVSITDEKSCDIEGLTSIHDFIEHYLATDGGVAVDGDGWDVIFYDDSSYEIADFIAFKREGESIKVHFVHCKSAGDEQPRAQVEDFYDVIGQAIRSLQHVHNLEGLVNHIRHRGEECENPRFAMGELTDLEDLVADHPNTRTYYVTIVQPGLTKDGISREVSELLASAEEVLRSRDCEQLTVIASA